MTAWQHFGECDLKKNVYFWCQEWNPGGCTLQASALPPPAPCDCELKDYAAGLCCLFFCFSSYLELYIEDDELDLINLSCFWTRRKRRRGRRAEKREEEKGQRFLLTLSKTVYVKNKHTAYSLFLLYFLCSMDHYLHRIYLLSSVYCPSLLLEWRLHEDRDFCLSTPLPPHHHCWLLKGVTLSWVTVFQQRGVPGWLNT